MRRLILGIALLSLGSITATAEPPPSKQATASAPAQTATDQSYAVDRQANTVPAASSTATVATDSGAGAVVDKPDGGHGWIWWTLLAAAVLAAVVLLFRYLTRKPETVDVTPRATADYEPPDSATRRPQRKQGSDD